MNAARFIQAIKVPRAVLACLAWTLLLGAAHAQNGLRPAAGGPQAYVSDTSDGYPTTSQARPLEPGAPRLGNPMAPSNTVVTITDDTVDPSELPPPGSAQLPALGSAQLPAPAWTKMWTWVPRGMVPFGPRTPDSEKDRGIGQPLSGNGWRSNPFQITAFSGVTDGGPLIPGHLHQQPSYYGGINLGWDFDHYFGFEKRLGFGALNLTNGEHQPIPKTGLSVTGEYRLMYYPLGDARWRPFLTAGIGWSDFYFNDDHGASHLDTVGNIPFGGGLKYLYNDRLALRVDLIDEMTFGGGVLSNFHYVALTVGLEFRYGHRLINMPWHKKPTGAELN